jgi:hypothetical protein
VATPFRQTTNYHHFQAEGIASGFRTPKPLSFLKKKQSIALKFLHHFHAAELYSQIGIL